MPARKRHCRRWMPAGAVLALILTAVAGCSRTGPPEASGSRVRDAVVVASFNFPESALLAEIYAQALEDVGVPVVRQGQVGPREIMEPALEQGLVDLVPEYLGSALAYLDPGTTSMDLDAEETRSRLQDILSARALHVLAHAPAENQNGIVVTPETASRYGLSAVSDLRPLAGEFVFGGPPECVERPFCLPGLRDTYGLEFESFLSLDSGGRQTRAALSRGDADVGLLFTTDGYLAAGDFVLLEDDRGLQPAENVVPMVRGDAVRRWGEALVSRLDAVTVALTTDALAQMNAEVEIERESPARVAARWLSEQSLDTG